MIDNNEFDDIFVVDNSKYNHDEILVNNYIITLENIYKNCYEILEKISEDMVNSLNEIGDCDEFHNKYSLLNYNFITMSKKLRLKAFDISRIMYYDILHHYEVCEILMVKFIDFLETLPQ